jgi:hypothetical protein
VAYIDDIKNLVAKQTIDNDKMCITAGRTYKFWHDDPKYVERFGRRFRDGELHDCELRGKDSAFKFMDDMGNEITFRQHFSTKLEDAELDEILLWDYFDMPRVKSIKEKYPDEYKANL